MFEMMNIFGMLSRDICWMSVMCTVMFDFLIVIIFIVCLFAVDKFSVDLLCTDET